MEKLKSIIRVIVAAGVLASAAGIVAPAATAETAAGSSPSGTVSAMASSKYCSYPSIKGIRVCTIWTKSGIKGRIMNLNRTDRRGKYGVEFEDYKKPRKYSWYGKTRTFGAKSKLTGWEIKCPKGYTQAGAVALIKGYYYREFFVSCKNGHLIRD